MDEILELRRCMEQHRYGDALSIIDEMEEMAKKDTVNKISSFIRILFIHLIKQHAEDRTTRSWQNSIAFAIEEIRDANERTSSKGTYLTTDELRAIIERKFPLALEKAAEEAFGGIYESSHIRGIIDEARIQEEALMRITGKYV